LATVIGTSFATSGFSYDPNLSPNNQSFSAAVLAVLNRTAAGTFNGTATALAAGAFANPSVLVSTTATNGAAVKAMRADAAPAIDSGMSPTWTGNHTFAPASGVALTVNPTSAAGETARFIAFSGTQKQSFVSWFQSDNATRRGYLGYGNLNDETLIIDSDIATGTISLRSNALVVMNVIPQGVAIFGTGSSNATPLLVQAGIGTAARAVIQVIGVTGSSGFIGMGGQVAGDLFIGGTFGDMGVRASNGRVLLYGAGGPGGTGVWAAGAVNGAAVDMSPDGSTFNGTATGLTTSPTSACAWSKQGNQVTLVVGTVSGSSNVNTFSIGQLPAAISPNRSQVMAVPASAVTDNSAKVNTISVSIGAGGAAIVFLLNDNSAGFTTAGTKGVTRSFTFTYLLN
jgi:hypothetical protein